MKRPPVHVDPNPETVATIVDEYGHHAARERWWWIPAASLADLAAEGRRRSGRARPTGYMHCLGAGQELVNQGWDGPEVLARRLTPSTAAAALGISAANLVRGW